MPGAYKEVKFIAIFEMEESEQDNSMQEVRLLKSLDHPSIVKYIDSFVEDSTLCIVMRYCEGGDLAAHIKKASKAPGGPQHFDEDQIVDWFIQLTYAIAYIHSHRVLHRDLKTNNVFLTSNNLVKLGDFGIARVLDYTMDHAKTVVGTPYYMSPEVCENKPYSYKSDMWALGCILYEMCTLRHAFDASNLLGLVYKIVQETQPPIPSHYSADLKHLVACMLAKDPAARLSPAQIMALPFIRKRIEGMASSGGTLGKPVMPLHPREAILRRKKEAQARREAQLRAACAANMQESRRNKERGRMQFRPTADAHTALTTGDARLLSKTADPGSSRETSPRSPPPRPRTVASGGRSSVSPPRSHDAPPHPHRSAWDSDRSLRSPGRPGDSPRVHNPADDRPITASGHYAFEPKPASRPERPRVGSEGSARGTTPPRSSPVGSPSTRAGAGDRLPTQTPPRHPRLSSSVSPAAIPDDDDEYYSDDFEEDDGEAYDPETKARDAHDKDLFMRILQSHIVDPDGVPGSREVATPMGVDVLSESKLSVEDEEAELEAAFSTPTPVRAPTPIGELPIRSHSQRIRDMRDGTVRELGRELFDRVYTFLINEHEKARTSGKDIDARHLQAQLLRFVDGDKRRYTRLLAVDQLVFLEEMGSPTSS